MSGLTAAGELTALLAAGYSLLRVLRTVLAVAGLFYLLTLVAALYLDPWGRRELLGFAQRKAYEKVANIRRHLQAGVFLRDIPGYVLHVQRVSAEGERYHNVMLAPRAESHNDFVITARTAQLEGAVETGDLDLVFEHGVIHTDDTVLQFDRWHLDLVRIVHQHLLGRKIGFDARRLYPLALWQHLQESRTHGELPSVHTQLLLQRRLGRPLLVLAFAVLGMLLGIPSSAPRPQPRAALYCAYRFCLLQSRLGLRIHRPPRAAFPPTRHLAAAADARRWCIAACRTQEQPTARRAAVVKELMLLPVLTNAQRRAGKGRLFR